MEWAHLVEWEFLQCTMVGMRNKVEPNSGFPKQHRTLDQLVPGSDREELDIFSRKEIFDQFPCTEIATNLHVCLTAKRVGGSRCWNIKRSSSSGSLRSLILATISAMMMFCNNTKWDADLTAIWWEKLNLLSTFPGNATHNWQGQRGLRRQWQYNFCWTSHLRGQYVMNSWPLSFLGRCSKTRESHHCHHVWITHLNNALCMLESTQIKIDCVPSPLALVPVFSFFSDSFCIPFVSPPPLSAPSSADQSHSLPER